MCLFDICIPEVFPDGFLLLAFYWDVLLVLSKRMLIPTWMSQEVSKCIVNGL